jgi:hypothetical protein
MKARLSAIIALLVGLAAILWLLAKGPSRNLPETNMNTVPVTKKGLLPDKVVRAPVQVPPAQYGSNTVIVEGVPIPQDVVRYMENVRADPMYDWKQPINFYGVVVDDTKQPIAAASVDYTWSTVAARGTLSKHGETDSSGTFSIHETGKRISITVSKDGYYTTPSERLRSYEYANPGDGLFVPDPNNPVVFHLRKRGTSVDLITSQLGVKSYFGVTAPLDGTPVRVDLIERKSGGQGGQLTLSQTKPPYDKWKQAAEWTFRMEIPDGGFVQENDEFPFEAPESGYQPVVQFDFQQGRTNWATMLKKDFYIKFGNPPRYGRLHLDTHIDMDGARFSYAVNPDGSRNLEPK